MDPCLTYFRLLGILPIMAVATVVISYHHHFAFVNGTVDCRLLPFTLVTVPAIAKDVNNARVGKVLNTFVDIHWGDVGSCLYNVRGEHSRLYLVAL